MRLNIVARDIYIPGKLDKNGKNIEMIDKDWKRVEMILELGDYQKNSNFHSLINKQERQFTQEY